MKVVRYYDKDVGIKAIEAICLVAVYGYMENQGAYYPIPPTILQLVELLLIF